MGWLLFQFYLYYQILKLLGVVPMVGVVGVENNFVIAQLELQLK
jgi:hypothetical protein